MPIERTTAFTDPTVPDGYERHLLGPLFEPWAEELVERASLRPGERVLDVACGLGPVARQAAGKVGTGGQVMAIDISPSMVKRAAERLRQPPAAPIQYVACSALAINARDREFDVVVCQQGIQFFTDCDLALREMRRVLRDGGRVILSTWSAEAPLGLFAPIARALKAAGLEEPYPRAFEPETFLIPRSDLESRMTEAGLREVMVETVRREVSWPSMPEAVATVNGTPFAPYVRALSEKRRERLGQLIAEELGGRQEAGPVVVDTTCNVVSAVR